MTTNNQKYDIKFVPQCDLLAAVTGVPCWLENKPT